MLYMHTAMEQEQLKEIIKSPKLPWQLRIKQKCGAENQHKNLKEAKMHHKRFQESIFHIKN